MVNFKDFDNTEVYEELIGKAKSADARNFVLDFSHDRARCCFDVDESDVKTLLGTDRPTEYHTRWINIWAPNRQSKIVDHLAAAYGFSPRLRGLMKSKHVLNSTNASKPRRSTSSRKSPVSSSTSKSSDAVEMKPLDVEKQAAHIKTTEHDLMRDLNHYDIVSSIYHYTSVDLGVKYFCIGYNMLHNVRPDRHDPLKGHDQLGFGNAKLPHGDRIWNWLIICDDRTVISMFEDPYSSLESTARKTHDASKTRYNLLNVFTQLSNVSFSADRNPISLVPVRHTEPLVGEDGEYLSQTDDRQPAEVDGPGLLFYYLFDDWWNSYALLTQHDHHYGAALDKLRTEMVISPRVEHVYSLQHIGRQLACLKRLYESYETVILRILEKQRTPPAFSRPPTNDSQSASQSPQDLKAATLFSRPVCAPAPQSYHPDHYTNNSHHALYPYDQYGLYLTSSARVRFERLRDRVRLYAIAEIAESIDLKDSLVTMNYNLIAVKESHSMEKLTRVTTLLSKATILFLPVSLLSAYFSIDWDEENGESVKAYWASFSVIFGVTFVLLVMFGVVSRTLEGRVVYQPLWRVGVEAWRGTRGLGRGLGRTLTGGGGRGKEIDEDDD